MSKQNNMRRKIVLDANIAKKNDIVEKYAITQGEAEDVFQVEKEN